jgi:EpsD family peptidyl-prolyl cis-trans isomerase
MAIFGAANVINKRNAFGFFVMFGALILLGGCNEEKKAATQVAAKVNGDEITVSEVNNVLGRLNGVTADTAPAAKQEILNKLIDQQLAVQQAIDKKLDRNPAVMQAIEAAKHEILARAYMEQVAAANAKPTEDDARKFYLDHPALFAQRRLYNLQELAVAADAGQADEIKQWVTAGKSMTDIATALKAKNIQFRANAGPSAAEQLPLELLPEFQAMKDGDTKVMQGPKALMVVHLLESKSQPVDEATALPRIQQFLANQRNTEAVMAEMKSLRDKAKIERLGEFAAAPAAAPAASVAAQAAAPATPVPEAAPAPAAPAGAGAIDDKAIAKGISGLK